MKMKSIDRRIAGLRKEAPPRCRGQGFRFKPFSANQRKVLGWWSNGSPLKDYDGIIADGAVRSGKTVAMALGFVLWAMNSFSGQAFAICGRTIGAVERNILVWLRQMLAPRGYKLEEKRSQHLLIISDGRRSNMFYLFAGKDESSQDLIQGMTLAGVYFDEVALMPETFVSQATARCSVKGSRWWFNCNPAGPYHWFKRGFIDKRRERNLLYIHFSMKDNLSLDSEIIRRYERMYSGVFYRRYILGQWCAAEGLVYSMFSEDRHVGRPQWQPQRVMLACDYGTQNPFALGLVSAAQTAEGVCYFLEKEFYHDGRKQGQMTDSQYADELERFAEGCGARQVVVDPSASSFIAELRRRGWQVIKARNDVAEGIRCVASALSEGRLMIAPECADTLREFQSYVWDKTACEKGQDKPLKQNDHAMDMLRYALLTDGRMSVRPTRYSGKGVRR